MRTGRSCRAVAFGLITMGLLASAGAQTPKPEEAPRPPARPAEAPAQPSAPERAGPPASGLSLAEIRDLLDSARATAKATRENVEYNRVVPDILTQILAKLDKIEDKLGKLEDAIKAQAPKRR